MLPRPSRENGKLSRTSLFAAVLAASLTGGAFTANACSFPDTLMPFDPNMPALDFHPGPAQKDPKAEGDYWEKVPAPVVQVVQVTRGTVAPGNSCDDAGTVTLAVSLPPSSSYSIKDFAIYFRVLEGRLPDEIFPDVPLVGPIEGHQMTIFLAWLDGHPSRQIPLDLKIEAFFLAGGLHIGKSTIFEVKG